MKTSSLIFIITFLLLSVSLRAETRYEESYVSGATGKSIQQLDHQKIETRNEARPFVFGERTFYKEDDPVNSPVQYRNINNQIDGRNQRAVQWLVIPLE